MPRTPWLLATITSVILLLGCEANQADVTPQLSAEEEQEILNEQNNASLEEQAQAAQQ